MSGWCMETNVVILPVDTDDEWVGYVNKCGDITVGYRL